MTLVVALWVGASGSAFAQSAKALEPFTTLCEEEAGTGFNWRQGTWVQANFIEEKYVIRKITAPSKARLDDGTVNMCLDFMRPHESAIGETAWLTGCYSVAKMGDDRPVASWCVEYFKKVGKNWEPAYIVCSETESAAFDMSFRPNGLFIMTATHNNVEAKPKDDYKDSLKVSHGKCSVIK